MWKWQGGEVGVSWTYNLQTDMELCASVCGINQTQGAEADFVKGLHKYALFQALFSLSYPPPCIFLEKAQLIFVRWGLSRPQYNKNLLQIWA